MNTMSNQPILFVDDDLISRLLNCAILRDSGFEVLEAGSYAQACRIIQHRRLGAVVTDIDLEDEADGFDVARRARAANAHIPVVYISGGDPGRHVGQGVSESRFIPKPLDPYQIVRTLDAAAPLAPARLK
jgi:CheY-like chemotaxis protein